LPNNNEKHYSVILLKFLNLNRPLILAKINASVWLVAWWSAAQKYVTRRHVRARSASQHWKLVRAVPHLHQRMVPEPFCTRSASACHSFKTTRTHGPLYSSSICPTQQDSLIYTQFSRTHPSSISSSIHSIHCATYLSHYLTISICDLLSPSRKERRLRDGHTYQGHGKMTLVPLSCNYYCSVHLVQHSNPKLLPILDPDPGREEDHGPPVDPGCGARKARRSECRRRRGGRRR
jgi:hypothetical protein